MTDRSITGVESAAAASPPALLGRYSPPDVRKGDRVYCRYRRAWCRVTGWGTGPIPWPRVQQPRLRGCPGLLVNATLERAIRTESALALAYWFGVSSKPVAWWRRAFGVGGLVGTRGSREVRRKQPLAGSVEPSRVMGGADRVARAPHVPAVPPEVSGRRRTWTDAELARLGTDLDEVVAEVLGRTAAAVTWQRCRRGIPPFRRPVTPPHKWTGREVALLGTDADEVIADRLGRTVIAVTSKRVAMRIAPVVPPARELATYGRSRDSSYQSTRSTGDLT